MRIPKKVLFIWLGGDIPEKYLQKMSALNAVFQRSGFEVNLLLDKPIHYHRAVAKHDLELSKISLVSVESLLARASQDPFYTDEPQKFSKFLSCSNREAIGLKNEGARADWYRYEWLRQEGGYYIDVDTSYLDNWDFEWVRAMPDQAPYGILLHSEVALLDGFPSTHCGYRRLNNDIMAAVPYHPVLAALIDQALFCYEKYDNTKVKRQDCVLGKPRLDFIESIPPEDLYYAKEDLALMRQERETRFKDLEEITALLSNSHVLGLEDGDYAWAREQEQALSFAVEKWDKKIKRWECLIQDVLEESYHNLMDRKRKMPLNPKPEVLGANRLGLTLDSTGPVLVGRVLEEFYRQINQEAKQQGDLQTDLMRAKSLIFSGSAKAFKQRKIATLPLLSGDDGNWLSPPTATAFEESELDKVRFREPVAQSDVYLKQNTDLLVSTQTFKTF